MSPAKGGSARSALWRMAHRRGPTRSAAPDGRDGGETLIELMVTVLLVGVAVVALLTTMITVVTSAHGHKRRVQAENEATSIVEAIDRMAYVPCANTSSYAAALASAPTPTFIPTITSVEKLQNRAATTATFGASCPGGGDQGAQQITVRVAVPGRYAVSAEVVLVKRDDTCPVNPPPELQIAVGDRC
jgi:type II secretory pathway pseudopilin PulG